MMLDVLDFLQGKDSEILMVDAEPWKEVLGGRLEESLRRRSFGEVLSRTAVMSLL